jgi:hypothetical protein
LAAEHFIERGLTLARWKTVGVLVVVMLLVGGIEAGGLLYPKTVPMTWHPTPNGLQKATVCRDGFISFSEGRGTCSWHGGIAR